LLAALVSTLKRPIGRLFASHILHQLPSILIKQTLNVIGIGREKQRNAIERGKSKREIRESRGENHGVASDVLFGKIRPGRSKGYISRFRSLCGAVLDLRREKSFRKNEYNYAYKKKAYRRQEKCKEETLPNEKEP
jgi:hypothetical protein